MPLDGCLLHAFLTPCNLHVEGYLHLAHLHLVALGLGHLLLLDLLVGLGVTVFGAFFLVFLLVLVGGLVLVVTVQGCQRTHGVALELLHLGIEVSLELIELLFLFLQGLVQVAHGIAESALETSLDGDVEGKESLLVIVLVEQLHVSIDDAADGLYIALEHEGGQSVLVLVVDDVEVHVAAERFLAGSGSQSESERDAHHAMLRLRVAEGSRLGVIDRSAVEVETAGDARDDQWVETQRRRLGIHVQVGSEESERVAVGILLGRHVVVAALDVELEEFLHLQSQCTGIAVAPLFVALHLQPSVEREHAEVGLQLNGTEVQTAVAEAIARNVGVVFGDGQFAGDVQSDGC